MRSLILIILLLWIASDLIAQEEIKIDSLSLQTTSIESRDSTLVLTDSTATQKRKSKKLIRGFFKKDYPHPKKAMLMSFIVPGAGQIYNKKYWKAPIAMGATISMIFVVRNNTQQYRFLRDEYIARLDNNDETIPNPGLTIWADEDIRAERDKWNKWKEMSYIGLVLVQALGGVDAFVDAHMAGFEINEDLTMKIKPTIEPSIASGTALGIGVSFQISASPPVVPKRFFNVR